MGRIGRPSSSQAHSEVFWEQVPRHTSSLAEADGKPHDPFVGISQLGQPGRFDT